MTNHKEKCIGIICGGWSKEREISLSSGTTTYNCLKDNGHNAFFLDIKENDKNILINFIKKNSIELIFNLVHGTGGEDGLIQSYLDEIGIKYIGSDSVSSKESFDKIATKNIWCANQLQTPDYKVLEDGLNYEDIVEKFGNNFLIKPIKRCFNFYR